MVRLISPRLGACNRPVALTDELFVPSLQNDWRLM